MLPKVGDSDIFPLVEMFSKVCDLGIFPACALRDPALPFPPASPSGCGSPPSLVLWGAPNPPHAPGLCFSLGGGASLGSVVERPPRFLDDPSVVHACPVLRPRQDLRARPHGPSVSPSAFRTTSAPAITILSGLNGAARVLPVYASPRRSPAPAQHSVPGGGQPCPGGV